MAANKSTLADEDGTYSDWIEIHNPDTTAADLTGWYLTDSASNKRKWQFPPLTIPAGGYRVVFASNKNRTNPAATLHTNFALSAGGEYLALVHSDGETVVSGYAPSFPSLEEDVSFGLVWEATGLGSPAILSEPTPGAANTGAKSALVTEKAAFSHAAGPFRNPFMLELSGAAGDQKIRYVMVASLQAATAPDPSADSPEYTAPLGISGSTLIKAAVFSADGNARGPVSSAYFARLDAALGNFTSPLPVVVVDSLGSGPLTKDGLDRPSWLYAYAAQPAGAPALGGTPEVISPMLMKVRGSSSAEFPKKAYSINFTDTQGRDRAQGLLGLPAYEKWALVAPWWYDLGYVNNAFVYALSNQLGRWAPRTRLVEMFCNDDGGDIDAAAYAGIYVLTDRIEVRPGRVEIEPMKATDTAGAALTGGYVLKIDVPDEDEIGWPTRRLSDTPIVLVSPKADEVAPAQVEYIQTYVQEMEDALFASHATGFAQRTYLDYLDRDTWVDHHLLNTFACNPDAFVRSAYFTKDRGGKLAAGPVWDFDRALGSYRDERSTRHDLWAGQGAPDVWRIGWWGVIAQDPEFMQDWVDRWQSLRRAALSDGNLLSLIEAQASQIGESAAARDAARWPDSANPHGTYAGQINHLRNWVVARAAWIDSQFLAPPEIAPSDASITFTPPEGAQLAYTLDGSDPRSLGGDIAPNAIVVSSAVTLPASANVHVRSYRAELRGVFPGSPWSSAVGTAASSPLLPRGRLINLSSRATVGSGENALIAGVVVADTAAKRYLARGIGPALEAFGAHGYVTEPQLGVLNSDGVELFRNQGWETGQDAMLLPSYFKSVGAFPLSAGSKDCALAMEIPAGNYTLRVTTPADQPGMGLAELYELDGNGRTVNLSTRARVGTGDDVLIGGFVVQGPAYKRMLVRGVGPGLAEFGVVNALVDPILTVYAGQDIVATNDRWEGSESGTVIAAASQAAGAFALAEGSEDAALLITLPPGAYTVEIRGKSASEGVALLEIYELP